MFSRTQKTILSIWVVMFILSAVLIATELMTSQDKHKKQYNEVRKLYPNLNDEQFEYFYYAKKLYVTPTNKGIE